MEFDFKFESRFQSVGQLITYDSATPLAMDDFDTELWLLLTAKISCSEDLESLPAPVGTYYASRLLQWEVGNGGFAQAAYNIPEWFGRAAAGYEALGKGSSARLIRKAIRLLGSEKKRVERKGQLRATIGAVFELFRDSQMASLDAKIPDDEWWIDDERVEYVRGNREAFRGIT